MTITQYTNIHLGVDRQTPTVRAATSGTAKWLDIGDGEVGIFFDDPDDVRQFAEALIDAAEGETE